MISKIILTLVGMATWYGSFHHGHTQANGKPFDKDALTFASRDFKLNRDYKITVVRVKTRGEYPKLKGRSIVCRSTDRGPYGAYITNKKGERERVRRMHRNKDDTWRVKYFDGTWDTYPEKPGKYRGLVDLSEGCMRALTGIKTGKLPNLIVKVEKVK